MSTPTPSAEELTRYWIHSYIGATTPPPPEMADEYTELVPAAAFDKERAARQQAERTAKLACDDWAYEKVETEKLLAPIIGQEFIDGDSYGVPTLGDTVEEAIRQLQAQLAAAAEREAKLVELLRDWLAEIPETRAGVAIKASMESKLSSILSPTVQQADSGKPHAPINDPFNAVGFGHYDGDV